MLTSVEGIYQGGRIEISEPINVPDGIKVIITFLASERLESQSESDMTLKSLTVQQSALSKIWDSSEEDIYGEV